MMLTHPKVEVIHATPSIITVIFSHKTTCKLPNVEGKLKFSRNNTLNKPIANLLNKFVDVYKWLEDTKMLIAEKHLALVPKCIMRIKHFNYGYMS